MPPPGVRDLSRSKMASVGDTHCLLNAFRIMVLCTTMLRDCLAYGFLAGAISKSSCHTEVVQDTYIHINIDIYASTYTYSYTYTYPYTYTYTSAYTNICVWACLQVLLVFVTCSNVLRLRRSWHVSPKSQPQLVALTRSRPSPFWPNFAWGRTAPLSAAEVQRSVGACVIRRAGRSTTGRLLRFCRDASGRSGRRRSGSSHFGSSNHFWVSNLRRVPTPGVGAHWVPLCRAPHHTTRIPAPQRRALP